MKGEELSEIITAYNAGSSIKFKNADDSTKLDWKSIAHNEDNMFVIVTKNKVARSFNAKDWTFIELKGDWVDVVYGNNIFIIVDSTGNIATSQNGYVWTRVETNFDSFKSITFGSNRFVAVGANNKIYYSNNGTGWNPLDLLGNWNNVSFCKNTFIISGTSKIAYSTTGITWEVLNTETIIDYNKPQPEDAKIYLGNVNLKGCAFGNGKYIFITQDSVIYSSDLKNYYKVDEPYLAGDWSFIKYIDVYFIIFSKTDLLYTSTGIDTFNRVNITTNLNNFDYASGSYIAVSQDMIWKSEDFTSENSWSCIDLYDDWRVITEFDLDVMWDSTLYNYLIVDEPVFLPFSTVSTFLNEYYTRFNVKPPASHEMPLIWLKSKNSDRSYLITSYTDEKVTMLNVTYNMESLFNNFTFNDGSIIGKLS